MALLNAVIEREPMLVARGLTLGRVEDFLMRRFESEQTAPRVVDLMYLLRPEVPRPTALESLKLLWQLSAARLSLDAVLQNLPPAGFNQVSVAVVLLGSHARFFPRIIVFCTWKKHSPANVHTNHSCLRLSFFL